MRRLLFVSRNLACPDFHGGCVYPYRVLESLSLAGFQIDYLWIPESLPRRPFRLPFRPVFCHKVQVAGALGLGSIYGKNPFQKLDLKSQVSQWVQSPKDCIVLDYLWDAELLRGLSAATWILTHERMYRRSESYRAAGVLLDFKSITEAEEMRLLEAANGLIAIQDEDGAWMRERFPGKPVFVLPPPFEPDAAIKTGVENETVLFIGGRTAHNRGALEWLVREVWPKVLALKPKARLRVYGTVDTQGLMPVAGVEFHGPTADLAKAYAENAVAVVPVRFGSGLKIKLLEAFSRGLPVVATSVGAEGFASLQEGRVCPVSDEPGEYAQCILRLFDEPKFRNEVRDRQVGWLKTNADPVLIGRRFADAVDNI